MTQQPYAAPPMPPPAAPDAQGQPAQQAPAKKAFYKNKWFLIIAAIIVVAIIATQGGNKAADTTAGATGDAPAVGDGAAAAAPAPAPAAAEPETATTDFALGQPAADGDFSFVVSGVDCSLTRIGDQYFGTDAQGQFCVVSVAVTNIGDSAQSFFGDNATLFNAQGQEFSADTEAAIYLGEASSIYEEINPGNTLNGKVVFDVPAGTAPTAIELHDSAFSGGVTVSLQ